MPTAEGWPTDQECMDKAAQIAPAGLSDAMQADIPNIRRAVIAEFESPAGRHGTGGTGRLFSPKRETRFYDGNGYAELRIDDILPDDKFTVRVFDTIMPDVGVKENHRGLGFNVLYRMQAGFAVLGTTYGLPSIFPLGKQNVTVEATFGMPITDDIWEAIRCEVAYRSVVQSEIGLDGVGEELRIGTGQINTNSSSATWLQSSPLPVAHRTYVDCVNRYRLAPTWRLANLGRRMS